MGAEALLIKAGLAVRPYTNPTQATTGGGLGGILSNKMIVSGNYTYLSGVDYYGQINYIQIDNRTRYMTSTALLSLLPYPDGQDDHNAAPFLLLGNGKLFTMGGNHASSNAKWWWRVSSDGTPQNLGPLNVFDTVTKLNLSYGQAFLHASTGDVYALFRTDTTNWSVFRSQDNAVSFTDLGLILDASASGVVRTYINTGWASADVLRFMVWQDPDSPTSHTVLGIADYNVVTGEITSGGGVVGTVGSGALRTACSTIWDYGANTQIIGNSMAPGGKAILATPAVSGDTTYPRYYLKLTNEASPYSAASWSKNLILNSNYNGPFTLSGLSTDQVPRIGVVRYDSNTSYFTIEVYTSDANGVTWTLAQTVASVFKSASKFAVKSLISCTGCDPNLEWTWLQGRYNDYNSYNSDLHAVWVR